MCFILTTKASLGCGVVFPITINKTTTIYFLRPFNIQAFQLKNNITQKGISNMITNYDEKLIVFYKIEAHITIMNSYFI